MQIAKLLPQRDIKQLQRDTQPPQKGTKELQIDTKLQINCTVQRSHHKDT